MSQNSIAFTDTLPFCSLNNNEISKLCATNNEISNIGHRKCDYLDLIFETFKSDQHCPDNFQSIDPIFIIM